MNKKRIIKIPPISEMEHKDFNIKYYMTLRFLESITSGCMFDEQSLLCMAGVDKYKLDETQLNKDFLYFKSKNYIYNIYDEYYFLKEHKNFIKVDKNIVNKIVNSESNDKNDHIKILKSIIRG